MTTVHQPPVRTTGCQDRELRVTPAFRDACDRLAALRGLPPDPWPAPGRTS